MTEEGWSQLPLDLLAMIVEYLPSADYSRMKAVCTTWNSAPSPLHPPTETPWLVFSPSLPSDGSSDAGDQLQIKENKARQNHDERCHLQHNLKYYSSCDRKSYKLRCGHLVDIMAECRAIISYSPGGWLMYMDRVCELQCIHLVTGERIHPPSIKSFPGYMGVRTDCHGRIVGYNIWSIGDPDDNWFSSCYALFWFYKSGIIIFPEHLLTTQYSSREQHSTNDTCSDYLIFVAYDYLSDLAFARKGDFSWTPISLPFSGITSFTLLERYLYVATDFGQDIIYIEFGSDLSFHSHISLPSNFTYFSPESEKGASSSYVVHLDGHLWLIWRNSEKMQTEDAGINGCEEDDSSPETRNFQVFKLDERRTTWIEMDTIGDNAIFVGNNYPLAFSIHDFPHLTRDCIYFTDDNVGGYIRPTCWDIGVFNLIDKTVSPLIDPLVARDLPQPIWIMAYPS